MVDRQEIVSRKIPGICLGDRDEFLDTQTLRIEGCDVTVKNSVEALRIVHRIDEAKRNRCKNFRIVVEFPLNSWIIHGKRRKGKTK